MARTGRGRGFAILVIWKDGDEEYLKMGMSQYPARFSNRDAANKQKDFMLMGADDEFQSVNVVPYPKEQRP